MNTSENKNPHRIDPMYVDVIDAPSTREILSREVQYSGYVLQAAVEHYDLDGQGTTLTRDVIHMPGSVAVAALNNRNEILLLRQYRHPVRMNLWEVPAGLLDITGEDPLHAAQRELAEETDLGAHHWRSLVDYYTTPGAASEAGRIYLAQDLYEIPEANRIVRRGEEAEITYRWVPLEQAVRLVLAGQLHNGLAIQAILAAYCAVEAQQEQLPLREAADTWDFHPYVGGRRIRPETFKHEE